MPHKTLTRAEVAKNNTEDSLWFIIDSKVYDASDFKDAHPGGEAVLKQGEAYSYAYLAFFVWKTRHPENFGGTLKVWIGIRADRRYYLHPKQFDVYKLFISLRSDF